jgi:hypothetical protein
MSENGSGTRGAETARRRGLLSRLAATLVALVAATIGTWLGARARVALSRDEPLSLNLVHTLPDGQQALALEIEPVRLGIALLPVLLGRSRWPMAFVLGFVSGALPNQPLEQQTGSFIGQVRSALP